MVASWLSSSAAPAVVGAGSIDAIDETVDAGLVVDTGCHVCGRIERHLPVSHVVFRGFGECLVTDPLEVFSLDARERAVVVHVEELVDVRVVVEILRLLKRRQFDTVLSGEVHDSGGLDRSHEM